MARGDRAAGRLRSVGRGRARGRAYAAGDRVVPRRSRRRRVQGPGGAAAERRAAGQCQRHLRSAPGERVLVSGPSGSGKSTLFRALAGIWPFGAGTITVPKNAKVMMLPQRPYFPIAPLGRRGRLSGRAGDLRQPRGSPNSIAAVGLPALADRIEEEAHWNRMLSLGEQQRLGIARALLHAPDYLFLDEATASLDEPAEAALYKLLEERLARRDHRLDRPPLDAGRVPPPAAGVQPRRRPLWLREAKRARPSSVR